MSHCDPARARTTASNLSPRRTARTREFRAGRESPCSCRSRRLGSPAPAGDPVLSESPPQPRRAAHASSCAALFLVLALMIAGCDDSPRARRSASSTQRASAAARRQAEREAVAATPGPTDSTLSRGRGRLSGHDRFLQDAGNAGVHFRQMRERSLPATCIAAGGS